MREDLFRFNRFLLCALIFAPCVAVAADNSTGFNMAAQLLSAARNGNTRLVQNLINSGADVNYVDSTGLSVVCTAVMNNDKRAVQILQMYGADASKCDRQIKNYNERNNPQTESGLFSGLSSTHKLVLGVIGTGAVIAGLLWLTDAFDGSNHNSGGNSSGSHSGNTDGPGGSDTDTPTLAVPYSPAYLNTNGTINKNANVSANDWVADEGSMDFNFIKNSDMQNYLLIAHGYDLFANRYNGQLIFRDPTSHNPLLMSGVAADVGGGMPATVALITSNGINDANGSLARGGGIAKALSISGAVEYVDKYKNYINPVCNGSTCLGTENTVYDYSGYGTAVENSDATNRDNNIAKIVAGWLAGGDRADGDLYGFIPYGTLAVYRTGGGKNSFGADISYYNYQAMYDAIRANYTVDVIANASLNLNSLSQSNYASINSVSTVNGFKSLIDQWYGPGQGDKADDIFSVYNTGSPVMVNPTGAYDMSNYAAGEDVSATFENYVPVLYGNKIDKNFMSVVAVQHSVGTSAATSVSQYGDGISGSFGKIQLSQWQEGDVNYRSRMCGTAGIGTSEIDPWCFAAPGEVPEYAVASMAGAVASLQKAFSYMSNQQIFNLLALTADGPFLAKNSDGGWYTTEDLVTFLKSKYTMSAQKDSLMGDAYLYAFKEMFGYGLINLQRAVTPGTGIYYYSNGRILSSVGALPWQNMRGSSVFGGRRATVPVSFYDVLTSADGELSLPRVWNMNLSFGNDASYGLYMGDTLAELKTRDENNDVKVGNLTFGFARSERNYDDNMGGVDNLSLEYDNGRYGFRSDYQHYLTDGAGRFTGLANPVLALASNAVTSKFVLHSKNVSLMGRGFFGDITTEGLLENDPAISNNFMSAKLGNVVGAESGIRFGGDTLALTSNIGTMHESGTVLGAVFDGMLNMGGADTKYVDSVLSYNVTDNIGFTLRGTYAWTHPDDVVGGIVNGVSELRSDSFAAGLRFGNFDFVASMPLALIGGKMYYSYADFDVDESNNLLVRDAGEYALDLTPDRREYRFNASYRHSFGDWTDGALGFIYRINPNNTDAFGNESIFMMKLSHRLGI